jgi:hypothetical protein
LTAQGQEFYSTLAAEVANVLCTGYAWKLLTALPEPWEAPATQKEGHPMAKSQAAAIRLIWDERVVRIPCEHLTLELEWDDLGHSTGNYVCIRCAVSVAQRHPVA